MEILITFLIIVIGVLSYTTYNLLRKNEKQEDILASYLLYMDQLSKIIEHSDERLQKIDNKGTFQSDDEIGWFFEQIKVIQTRLNNFKLTDDRKEK
jgi:Tfp pilus assembly protein PilV